MAAAASQGFSIREYTEKMRVVDVEKCWPFSGGGGDKEQVEATLLPPITVTKFRWWSHELNKINQQKEQGQGLEEDHCLIGVSRNEAKEKEEGEDELEIVCPVCGNFATESMEVFNAHVNTCLAHAQREEKKAKTPSKSKSKSKSPKKRSILEIFAVSPQVEKVDDADEESDDDDGKDDYFNGQEQEEDEKKMMKKKKTKIKKTKKIKNVVIGTKLTMDRKKNKWNKKKKKMKKMKNNKGSIAFKGNAHKLKLPVPVMCSGKVNGSFCNKRIPKAILDDVSVHQHKSGLKGSIRKKNGVEASKFIAKHQKEFIPIRGILKNHTKAIDQQNSEICNVSGSSQANCCELQYSDRHVRFSGKDDILGPMKNKFSSSEKNAFDTYPNILANQSDQDHSTESDKESDAVGLNGSGDIDVSTGNGAELQTKINKKQLAGINDPVATPDFLRLHQEKEQHILDILSTSPVMIHGNDLHMFPQRHPNGPNKPTHASNLRLLPTMNEAHNPHVNSQFCGNVPMPSDSRGKSIDYFEDLTHGFAAIDSLASTRAFSQPSSSNFPSVEVSNRSFSFMPQSSIISISGQALQNQPYYHLSPMGFRVSDRRQTVGVLGERCMDGEFYGLPLNSHGELIQVSSSGRVGVDHMKKSTMLSFSSSSYQQNSVMSGSFSGFASEKHPNEQGVPNGRLDLLPIQKKHNVHLPPQFSVAGLPNTGRLDAHSLNPDRGCSSSVYPFDSNLSSTNISLNQCRQYIQSQNENQMAHMKKNSDNMSLKTVLPTMRLMGKDVAVGRSNTEMQSFEDGNIWMDKEIIQEHRPSSNDLGHSLLKRQIQQERILCPALEKSKETLHLPLEFESNQASQSNFQMKAQEFRASHPFYNWKTSSAFQNGDLTVEPNSSSSELHPTAHPFSLDMLYKGANLQDYLISGAENAGISSQVPVMSTLLNTRPHMGCRPTELNYQQNLPNARKSAFDFPFLHPDYNEHNQSSSFPTSSKNLPPWSVHASPLQVKTGDMASKNFSDVGCTHHPSCTSGTNFLTPLYHSSVVSDPHSSVISGPPLRSSLGSVLFIEPPGFPFSTGVHSNSSIDMSYRDKIIIQERMKSNSLGVKVPDHCQKIKKRPAAISSGSLRPTKMPNLMQEDLSAVTELTRETSSSEIWQNIAAYEARSKGDKGIGLGCCSYEAQKNGLGTSSDSDFSKADTLTKPGPMKLTAGAKHILKPSQKMDHDNSRLIHSTIPFPGATDCESFLDSQRKSTMIYRF